MAAQTLYTDELADEICELISTTSLGVNAICKQLGIHHSTVRRWIADKDNPMCDKYARAKELQITLLFEEILDIADDGSNDLMRITKANGEEYETENKEVTNRSKLRVEARKWQLSKLKPKVYGDKLELSGDADNPITVKNVSFE